MPHIPTTLFKFEYKFGPTPISNNSMTLESCHEENKTDPYQKKKKKRSKKTRFAKENIQ